MADRVEKGGIIVTGSSYGCYLEKVDFGQPGEFVTVVFSADHLEGRGTSRNKRRALAYALEDLARQLKEGT